MKRNNFILAQEWLRLADNDELAAETLLREKVAPSTVCFLSQQCAEKSLKGLIEFKNIEVIKIHDLVKLAGIIKPFLSEVNKFGEKFALLNKYCIESRYSADIVEGISLKEAETALKAAKEIKKFVIDKIFE